MLDGLKGVNLKNITFDEYLMALTDMIKKEPENMLEMANEKFAKQIHTQFVESVNTLQDQLLQEAFPNTSKPLDLYESLPSHGEERLKAQDSLGMNEKQRKALDSYTNNALLIGQSDIFSSFDSYDFNMMIYAWPLWTSMYASSWVFAKIIDRTGSDMIRNGWKINVEPSKIYDFVNENGKIFRKDVTPDIDLSRIYKKQSKVISYLVNAAKWMLLYGGSVICLLDNSIEDIRDYQEPLKDLPAGTKLNFIVADRWQGVVASSELVDDDESPDFNTPKYYSVRTPDGSFYRFHHTRVARFNNGETPTFLRTMLMGWGLPIGTRIYNEVNRDERIKNMITSLLSKYNLEIVQTAGMKAYMHGELTPEMEANLDYKLSMINRYRHFNSMMFLDKDDTYQRLDGNVGGLYQLFDSNTRAVTGAASMPVVLLYGDQSQGLSGSSFDDLRLWDDFLGSERGSKLRKPVEKITRWLLMSEGIDTENFSIHFNSSLPKTINEKVDETRSVLDTYNQLMSMGIYTKEMVIQELKERDDLLMGNQLQIKAKELLQEIREGVSEESEIEEDDFEGFGGFSDTEESSAPEFDENLQDNEPLDEPTEAPDEPTTLAPAEE
jgi:phage-related protein (TIGR01555 family)